MTLTEAKNLRTKAQSLTREIGALELDALSKGWTADTGILVLTLAHRRLDDLEKIEDFLAAQDRAERMARERFPVEVADDDAF